MRSLFLSIAVFCVGVLSPVAGSYAQERGGTLNLIVHPEPPTINIGVGKLGPTSFIAGKVYEGLVSFEPDLTPIPRLAESWEISDDGLTYTFKLRENVVWHDGEPFSSSDVLFSFKEYLPATDALTRTMMAQVEEITAPDDFTVVFKLKEPFPGFMMGFELRSGVIMPEHLYEGVEDYRKTPVNEQIIGTGPFKLERWSKGSYVHLVRHDDYWMPDMPYLDELYFHVIPDANSRAIAFETGQVDVLRSGDVENFDVVRLSELPEVAMTNEGWEYLQPVGYLQLNNSRAPFDNVLVRRAVAHAIDRDFIIETIFSGFGREVNGPLSDRSPYKDTSVETRYDFDPDKARALLDEAGLKPDSKGVRATVELVPLPYGETWQRLAEYTREALGEVGFDVNIESVDVPGWLSRIDTFAYDLTYNFVYQRADPVIGVDRTYLTNPGPTAGGSSGNNVMNYSDPDVDRILKQARTENDAQERKKLYTEFQRIVSRDVPMVWTHDMIFPTLYREKIQNLITTGVGTNDSFADVWVAK